MVFLVLPDVRFFDGFPPCDLSLAGRLLCHGSRLQKQADPGSRYRKKSLVRDLFPVAHPNFDNVVHMIMKVDSCRETFGSSHVYEFFSAGHRATATCICSEEQPRVRGS